VIRAGSIVIRVDDLERMFEFWSAALDYVPRDRDDPDFVRLKALGAPRCTGSGCRRMPTS
jgi:hypothetical protein